MANSHFYPVIVAGGRGTRFWPLSRKRRAKQLLPLNGSRSMIQQTFARLRPLAQKKNFWVITNDDLRGAIVEQLKEVDKKRVIAEPVGRNTAPAIGLAAFILEQRDPEAVIGMFPADHVIADEKRFRKAVEEAAQIAADGENIVVMGIAPTRAETGYGYIETAEKQGDRYRVRRFTEKPDATRAQQFLAAGNYFWNSGMFIWRAATLANALREHLPNTARVLQEIAQAYSTRKFEKTLNKLYPKVENISVDYAVLEPRSAKGELRSGIYCIPADFGWNDLGSWTALHEHKLATSKKNHQDGNVVEADRHVAVNAARNYIFAPGKFVATVGVENLVIVETEDALLITTLERSQDVGKVVKYLDEKKLKTLV
jgi:mannose-1-phosphate guanylyltransferase